MNESSKRPDPKKIRLPSVGTIGEAAQVVILASRFPELSTIRDRVDDIKDDDESAKFCRDEIRRKVFHGPISKILGDGLDYRIYMGHVLGLLPPCRNCDCRQ